jgi:hypothetical protein
LLSGGCNSQLSGYNFSSGAFNNLQPAGTKKACLIDNDAALTSIIFGKENLYWIGQGISFKALAIKSALGSTLLYLVDQSPNS